MTTILTLYRICFIFLAIAVFGLSHYVANQARKIDKLEHDIEYAVERESDDTKAEIEEILRQHGLEVDDYTVIIEYEKLCELSFYLDDLTDLAILDDLYKVRLVSLDIGGTKVKDLTALRSEFASDMYLECLSINETSISDLSPLIGHPIHSLDISSTKVTNLTSLAGMPLTSLQANFTRISDLTPLKDKRLEDLELSYTHISDISPLEGMPIEGINISGTQVVDLSPLRGMPLYSLNIQKTKVTDLTPIKDMNLSILGLDLTSVSNLEAIAGMPLTVLSIIGTDITDLTPLDGMSLEVLAFEPWKIKKGMEIVRSMPNLRIISVGIEFEYTYLDVSDFWRCYDNGKFLAGAQKWKTEEEIMDFIINRIK